MRLRNLIVGAIVSASMLIAAPAFAQNASQGGYPQPGGSIQEQISTKQDPPDRQITQTATTSNQPGESGNLPFTGLDVALIMAAGGLLLAMGFGIRRLSRSEVA